jgi:hypothetical protein
LGSRCHGATIDVELVDTRNSISEVRIFELRPTVELFELRTLEPELSHLEPSHLEPSIDLIRVAPALR